MAADVAEQLKPAETAPHDPVQSQRKPKKWLVIGAIILIVVIVQVVVTALFLPGHAASDAGRKHDDKDHATTDGHHADGHHADGEADGAEGEFAEVPLGDFSFSNGTAAPGMIIHVDFKLSAVTTLKQASSLEAKLKQHLARVRQAVNKIVRMSSLEELNDPNLATIKRLIREDINRVLQKSYVVEAVISDMRTMEQ